MAVRIPICPVDSKSTNFNCRIISAMFRSAKFILYLSEKAFREQRFATPVLFHLRNLIIRQSEKQYRLAVGFKIVSDGKQLMHILFGRVQEIICQIRIAAIKRKKNGLLGKSFKWNIFRHDIIEAMKRSWPLVAQRLRQCVPSPFSVPRAKGVQRSHRGTYRRHDR